tara:strand:- start:119 stop:622 length:504 start_codon:yes stop_codon:yes gene_type:complete
MDNADSSPAITFPNVPDDFCPTGNWQNVFQVFIDEVLSNGTILVPGLGDVTPQQVAQINEDLADQQTQITALDTRVDALEPAVKVRYGILSPIASGDTVSTGITFSSPLPSAVYGISLIPIYASGTPLTTPLYTIVSQNTAGFTIRIDNNIAEITSLNWLAVHSSTP